MATPSTLADSGSLLRYEDDEETQSAERLLFLFQGVVDWIDGTLVYYPRIRGRDLTPLEQVEALFHDFVYARDFTGVGHFVNIMPQGDGVYEMKTPDVRVFGWFYRTAQFIAHSGALKNDIKGTRAVGRIRREVVQARSRLNLDQPAFIRSSKIHELI